MLVTGSGRVHKEQAPHRHTGGSAPRELRCNAPAAGHRAAGVQERNVAAFMRDHGIGMQVAACRGKARNRWVGARTCLASSSRQQLPSEIKTHNRAFSGHTAIVAIPLRSSVDTATTPHPPQPSAGATTPLPAWQQAAKQNSRQNARNEFVHLHSRLAHHAGSAGFSRRAGCGQPITLGPGGRASDL